MMIYNIAIFYLAMVVQFIGYHGIVAENFAGVANDYMCMVTGDDHADWCILPTGLVASAHSPRGHCKLRCAEYSGSEVIGP